MKWYVSKIVFRIICGDGNHMAQFDEQLRLVAACNEEEAFCKAVAMGKEGEDIFRNLKQQLVQWQFVNVSELYPLSELTDGAEIYSRISEVDDVASYITFVNRKAESLQGRSANALLNLT